MRLCTSLPLFVLWSSYSLAPPLTLVPAQLNSQISNARAAAERAEAILSKTYDLKLKQEVDSNALVAAAPIGDGKVDEDEKGGTTEDLALAMVAVDAPSSATETAEDLRLSRRRSAMRAIVQKLHEQESDIKMM